MTYNLLSGLGLKGFDTCSPSFFDFFGFVIILEVVSFVSFGFLSLGSFFWRFRMHFRNPKALVLEFMP